MTFLARENRQGIPITSDNQIQQGFGRGRNSVDQTQMDSKLSKQEIYRLELQEQIKIKEERKRQQLESVKREDERFIREIEEIKRKESERLEQEREKQQKLFEENNSQSPNLKRESTLKEQRASRILNSSNPQIKQPRESELSRYDFQRVNGDMYRANEPEFYPEHQFERQRPILFEEYEQNNQYYQERVKRHKEQMNEKLEELLKHIHSTKDNIKAEEEIEKIKRRIRSKPLESESFAGYEVEHGYENNFYQIPKKQYQQRFPSHENQSRVLDYQSTSKFTSYNNKMAESRSKIKTQYQDIYKIPYANETERKMETWGTRPTEGRYGTREALDFQIAKTLEGIDEFQDYLKKKGE